VFEIFWQFSAFFLFWLLVSGAYDWQHLVFGVIVAGIIASFWHHRSERVISTFSLRRFVYTLRTLLRLVREVWVAAWQVVPVVLNPRLQISPVLVPVHTTLKTNRMRTLFANSITLTPGTLTVELHGDHLLVHALTAAAGEGVEHWSFEQQLKELEEA